MTKDALLEIGSEELPASFVPLGIKQLKIIAESSLKENGLAFASVVTYGTPRRLAVVISGLPDRNPDQKKTISGPPAAMAKDGTGQWTAAALGFARKQGVKPSDLTIENERLCAVQHIKGTATKLLLAELFPSWIGKLEFPKSMTWEPTHFRFPRPIRWLCAVYGQDLISFSLAGVRSCRWTMGLMLQSTKNIPISSAGKYVMLLKNQCVLVEPSARQDCIQRLADQAVKRVHGKVHMNPALLEQVSNLVEHPCAILGNFDPAYLDLPKEVLITCLEHHQKFFPVEQATGVKLLPHFIGIRNGMSVHQEIVKEGYERVLAARLADARFFFNHDRKTPLSAKVDALKGVMFQEKLGNLFEKKERVKQLLKVLASSVTGSSWLPQAERTADLCKADLVTDMVREFPELQGIMARIYAQLDGEEAVVAEAAEQHYWPITLTGALPESEVAAAVALADKLDTLAGDFAVGLIPSGSADPYGLRRAAVGVLRILESTGWSLGMEWLVDRIVEMQPVEIKEGWRQTQMKLHQFMRQRFAALLEERGYKFDEIDAVLSAGIGVVAATIARLEALRKIRTHSEFTTLATVFKRSSNIVRQALQQLGDKQINGFVDENLFQHDAERDLYQAVRQAKDLVVDRASKHQYSEALEAMLPVAAPLDKFFKDVMVMADDPKIRENRLAIMFGMVTQFAKIADFSKLQNA